MRVSLDTRQWERALEQLGPKYATKAAVRAITRTAKNARTAMVRVVATDMSLQQKFVRDRITASAAKASGSAPSAYLYADSKRVPLISFGAKGPEPSRGRGRGVKAKLRGKAAYPNAFIATMKSGHRGVYQRSAKTRLPIYELRGPSVMQSFITHRAVAEARAIEMLTTNMASEVRYLVSQAQQ